MKKIIASGIGMILMYFISMNSSISAPWPEKAIMVYCGWAAGGTSDIASRSLALQMEKSLG